VHLQREGFVLHTTRMKYFINFFRYLWLGIDGFRKILHLLLLLLVFGVVIAALSSSQPAIPKSAVLVINPQGEVVEQLSGSAFERAMSEATNRPKPETLLRDMIDSIKFAADDARVRGLLLDTDNLTGAGLSKLQELAAALQTFRKSGKPIIAAGESYDQAQYFLAAQADEIYLDPKGAVFIDGFGYYRMFLKEAIDKLGIDMSVFRAGKFKSYTDQYSRNDMSDQEREESSAWLNALWAAYQNDVTTARKLNASALGTYTQQLSTLLREKQGNFAAVALDSGLVNELKTRQEVEQRLVDLTGMDDESHSYYSIDFRDYVKAERPKETLRSLGHKQIAVVVASGEILDGDHPPGTIGGDSTAALLREARFDEQIAAVVLRIDSPGGSVFASEVIRREIEALKAAGKPIIASMSSTAASGGYYIAMNADEIWASPTTLTGSIGVFSVVPSLERTLAKLGIHTDGIGTTPLSGGVSMERSLSAQQREILQLSVDYEYRQFTGKVAQARGKTEAEIDTIAQGRVWAGSHAQERGLVDHLGSFQDAIAAAATRANLGKDYALKYIESQVSWRQALVNEMHVLTGRAAKLIAPEEMMAMHPWIARVTPLEAELKRVAHFAESRNENQRSYYYCVCTVQ
jgi:protease IV